MKTTALALSLLTSIGTVQAHVADLPAAQHAAGHGWLAIALVPLLAVLLPWLRGRR